MCEYDDSSFEMSEMPETSEVPEETKVPETSEIPEEEEGGEAMKPTEPVEEIPEEIPEETGDKPSVRDTLHNIREENPGDSQGTDFRPTGQGPIVR